jgi:N-acetylmuramoyl-L-alanine amidase
MNFISGRPRKTSTLWLAVAILLVFAGVVQTAGAPEQKRISVYSTAANYSLPVSEQNGRDYIGLLEILEPLGSVSAKTNRNHWKLQYNDVACEFVAGKKKARVRGKDFDLPANFLLDNDRGLVPISSLGVLLPRILGGPVTLNESARRLFIGNVGVHFTAEVSKTTPPKLVINFTSPVNPTIATEPGKLRMEFSREPVVAPGSPTLTFGSTVIPSARFQENNGAAELVVSTSVPLMATFSNDGRTITVAPPAATAPPSATAPPAKPQPPTVSNAGPPTVAPTPTAPLLHYFAVVDASHGGDERGAALTDQIAEKDITLAMARSLRQALVARGLATLLVRDADVTLSTDQRAAIANGAAPAIYICIHASSEGHGVRLYTAILPVAGENHGPFIDWNTAQSPFQQASLTAEEGVADALKFKKIPVRSLTAALRPLNNVTSAALAVEVAPEKDDIVQLGTSTYQQFIADAVAAGLAEVRDKLKVEAK